MADYLAWENGDRILWESGDLVLWDDSAVVTFTDFTQDRIFQRNASSTAKMLTFSGTYGGPTLPSSVEVKIVNDADDSTAQDWTALSSASITEGGWSGQLSVPQGGWYNFIVRTKDSGGTVLATSSQSSNTWSVGVLVAMIGQSNMQKMWTISSSPPTVNSKTKAYTTIVPPTAPEESQSGGWGVPVGNGAIRFADRLQTLLGFPVGILTYAIGATALHAANSGSPYWMDLSAGAPYPLFVTGLTEAGGDCEFVLWHQGEWDAQRGTTLAEYKADMDTLYSRIRTATGRSTSTLKFGCALLGSMDDGASPATAATMDAIRQAQLEWIRDTTGAFCAGSSVDMVRTDFAHWTAPYYERMGRRYAQAILHQTGGAAYGGVGPSLTGAVRATGSAVVVLSVSQVGGSSLLEIDGTSDGGSLTGFEVSNDNFATTLTISSTAFSAGSIQLTLSAVPTGTVKVRYQYGETPNITNPVYDNTAPGGDSIGLPLQPSIGSLTVTGEAAGGAASVSFRQSAAGINFYGNRR